MKGNESVTVRIRVGIATDEPISGRGLLSILQEDVRYRIIWLPAVSGRLEQSVSILAIDVLLIDMAGGLDREIAGRLRRAGLKCPIILWAREEELEESRHLSVEDENVNFVLDKRLGPDMLLACIESVVTGRAWEGRETQATSVSAPERMLSGVRLSRREGEMIRLVSQGSSNKEIAEELHLTEGSVKVYLSRLFRKLGVRDRVGLAVYSLQNAGLVQAQVRNRVVAAPTAE